MHAHGAFFLLLFTAAIAATSGDISSETAALLRIRSAVGGRTLSWNTSLSSPCAWQGVRCDDGGSSVAALRLPASSLSGAFPSGVLSNLTSLRTLSLRLNHLTGPLPEDLSRLTSLRNLYLQGNMFSGPVPESLFTMSSLVRLNLGGNNFSGGISDGFNNLTRLRTLYLENNGFSGILPNLSLPNLNQFNVSFNPSLNGVVPMGLASLGRDSFMGTSLCGKPLDSVCGGDTSNNTAGNDVALGGNKKKGGLSGGAVAGVVIGSVVGLLLLISVAFFSCRKRNGAKARSAPDTAAALASSQGGGGGAPSAAAASASESGAAGSKELVFFGNGLFRVFDLEELLRASAEVLGKGAYGTSYKAAVLEAGAAVVVKRLRDVDLSEAEFRVRVEGLGAMEHENLVPIRAYYYSREEKLLVYDFMPMGSVSALLHGAGRTPLSWETRSKIALGTARGIEYIHSQSPATSHGSIKSSNVLLTEAHDPRVADFCLNRVAGPTSPPQRAEGYRAPEVTEPQRVSQEADVYSFGVFLLELLTGKATEGGVDLPRWVRSVVREEWASEVFDLGLLRYGGNNEENGSGDVDRGVEEEMVELLQLGIDCTAPSPEGRPSMMEVVRRIEEVVGSLRGGDGGGAEEISNHVSEIE